MTPPGIRYQPVLVNIPVPSRLGLGNVYRSSLLHLIKAEIMLFLRGPPTTAYVDRYLLNFENKGGNKDMARELLNK